MTDSSDRKPQVVAITGASRGIGAAIAARFLAQGDIVASLDRVPSPMEGVHSYIADVSDTQGVNAAFDAIEKDLGRVSVLVANAGITQDTLLMRMSDEEFGRVIDVNLTGVFRCVRRASTSMIRARYGRIILMGSVVGLYGGSGQVNYSASKAALVGMARSVTRELGGRGITANVVAPGFIDTDMTAVLPDDVQATYKAAIPAGRFGHVDDIAAAVTFLAGDSASYISGAVIPVDGGLGMGH